MAAPHKCEGCFTMTTAESWTCPDCQMEGRAAQLEVARAGGNMAEQLAAFQGAVYARAQRVKEGKVTHPTPQTGPSYMSPVPAGKIR